MRLVLALGSLPLTIACGLALLLAAVGPGCSGGSGGYGPGHARLALVSEPAALIPGAQTLLGVSFAIEPGWHLYWNGQNDTGYPPRVEIDLPEGYVAGDLQWPAPRRYVSPGGILDHVYHDRVTLLLPVHAPADAEPGARVRLRVRADWLACKSECLPGRGEASLALEVTPPGEVPPPADPEGAEWIARARSTIPSVTPVTETGVTLAWIEDTLVVRVPGDRAAAFYPDTASVAIEDLLHRGESADGELRLHPRRNFRGTAISGVLATWGVLETAPAGGEAPAPDPREASGPDTVYSHVQATLPAPNPKETDR